MRIELTVVRSRHHSPLLRYMVKVGRMTSMIQDVINIDDIKDLTLMSEDDCHDSLDGETWYNYIVRQTQWHRLSNLHVIGGCYNRTSSNIDERNTTEIV